MHSMVVLWYHMLVSVCMVAPSVRIFVFFAGKEKLCTMITYDHLVDLYVGLNTSPLFQYDLD